MVDKFQDQGGAASMDLNPVTRWLNSTIMSTLFSPKRTRAKHAKAERKRVRQGSPHRIEYFHQVDDGYSHLALQMLPLLEKRYDIEIVCHLVTGPEGKNVAESDLLLDLSRYDARRIASAYGLEFAESDQPPSPGLLRKAMAILAGQDDSDFIVNAGLVSRALWDDNEPALDLLTESMGYVSEGEVAARIARGVSRRAALHHYSGAMFHYGGEWYWGVDRLYHLEKRLSALGADRDPGMLLLAPRPKVDVGDFRDCGSITLEFFPSLRSPYTAIVYEQVIDLVKLSGVKLELRPVLPMVMRGVPATREKGLYIFMDVAREAMAEGLGKLKFYDPIGDPVRRCYALYPWAVAQGRGEALIGSFLRHAFFEGTNTNNDRGLRRVVEDSGLDWDAATEHWNDPTWESLLEDNRLVMYQSGLWGVPSFRLLNSDADTQLAVWGQDRLWLVAQEIKRMLGGH